MILIGDVAHTPSDAWTRDVDGVNDTSVFSSNPTDPFGDQALKQYEPEARRFSDTIIKNNERVFRAFQAIGKNIDCLQGYLPTLHEIGFKEAR